jgi:dCTP deaminase
MILNSQQVAKRLRDSSTARDPLIFAPCPDLVELETAGAASVDLRLGTWFVTTKISRHSLLDVYKAREEQPSELNIMDRHYVRFGDRFILHPRSFVLAATLEWIRLPRDLAGYVTGRSSWGRRGLVIETAPGVHPGFTGCLTLELANVGEIPIAIMPGTTICQLFLHRIDETADHIDQSIFIGKRRPVLGEITVDSFAEKLQK